MKFGSESQWIKLYERDTIIQTFAYESGLFAFTFFVKGKFFLEVLDNEGVVQWERMIETTKFPIDIIVDHEFEMGKFYAFRINAVSECSVLIGYRFHKDDTFFHNSYRKNLELCFIGHFWGEKGFCDFSREKDLVTYLLFYTDGMEIPSGEVFVFCRDCDSMIRCADLQNRSTNKFTMIPLVTDEWDEIVNGCIRNSKGGKLFWDGQLYDTVESPMLEGNVMKRFSIIPC